MPKRKASPIEGAMVSPHKQAERVLDPDALTVEALEKYILDNWELLESDEHSHFGGGYNDEDGKYYLDVSVWRKTPAEAQAIGEKSQQEAYFDVRKRETVYFSNRPSQSGADLHSPSSVAGGNQGTSRAPDGPGNGGTTQTGKVAPSPAHKLFPGNVDFGFDRNNKKVFREIMVDVAESGAASLPDDDAPSKQQKQLFGERQKQMFHRVANAVRLRYQKQSEFVEAEHPRDDEGKFTGGGGGTAVERRGPPNPNHLKPVADKYPRRAPDDGRVSPDMPPGGDIFDAWHVLAAEKSASKKPTRIAVKRAIDAVRKHVNASHPMNANQALAAANRAMDDGSGTAVKSFDGKTTSQRLIDDWTTKLAKNPAKLADLKGFLASLTLGRDFQEEPDAYFERKGLKEFRDWAHPYVTGQKTSPKLNRADMPQIAGKDQLEFIDWLQSQYGISAQPDSPRASDLKPTQANMSADKVAAMVKTMRTDGVRPGSPVLASSDGYILDGHHRWQAQLEVDPDSEFPVIRVGAGIDELVNLAKKFPKSFTAGVDEAAGRRKYQRIAERIKYAAWREADHPRDADGKFTGEGDHVTFKVRGGGEYTWKGETVKSERGYSYLGKAWIVYDADGQAFRLTGYDDGWRLNPATRLDYGDTVAKGTSNPLTAAMKRNSTKAERSQQGASKPRQDLHNALKVKIADALTRAEHEPAGDYRVSSDKIKDYGDTIHGLMDKFGDKALESFHDGIAGDRHGIVFYQNTTDLNHTVQGRACLACYAFDAERSRRHGTLHLDGGEESQENNSQVEVYAHEMTHAMDGPSNIYSGTPKWRNAWKAEILPDNGVQIARVGDGRYVGTPASEAKRGDTITIRDRLGQIREMTIKYVEPAGRGYVKGALRIGFENEGIGHNEAMYIRDNRPLAVHPLREAPPAKLSDYATTETYEGFAEFGRLVYTQPEKAREYPKCYAAWKEWGLING